MGKASRPKPARLAEKLLRIRHALGLSQNQLIDRLGLADLLSSNRISEYERGEREPQLLVLLQYSELANVHLEVLADDNRDLPARLPSLKKSEGIKRHTPRS